MITNKPQAEANRQHTHVKVFLDPCVRRVPVQGSNVAVHVTPGEVLLGHFAIFEIGHGGKVGLDAEHSLMTRQRVTGRGVGGV